MDQQPPAQTPPPQGQWNPPPQQQWTPPPQQPMGWGGPGYGGPPPRPTGVTLAAIYLIVMGVLLALGGAACGLLGGGLSTVNPGDVPGAGGVPGNPFAVIGGAIAVIGIIVLVLGILSIAAGAGALGGKGWGRWIGIVVSVLFVVLGVLSIVGSLGTLNQTECAGMTGLVFWVVITVAYALTAYALVAAGNYFSYRR
jgi:hypothetical protein